MSGTRCTLPRKIVCFYSVVLYKEDMFCAMIMLLIINEIVSIGDMVDEEATTEPKITRNHVTLAAMQEMQHIDPYPSNLFAINCEKKYHYALLKPDFLCKHHYLWLCYVHCYPSSVNIKEKYFFVNCFSHNIDLKQKTYWRLHHFKFPTCMIWKTLRDDIWSNTSHFQSCCTRYNIKRSQKYLNYKFISADARLNIKNYKSFHKQSFLNVKNLEKADCYKHQSTLNLYKLHMFYIINRCKSLNINKNKCICGLIKSEVDEQFSAYNRKEATLLKLNNTKTIQGKFNYLTQNFAAAFVRGISINADVNISSTKYAKKKIDYQTNMQKHINLDHPASTVLWKSSNYLLRSQRFIDSKPIQKRKLLSIVESPESILNTYPLSYLNKNLYNRQTDRHYNQVLSPGKGYISQKNTDKFKKYRKRSFHKIKSNKVEDAIFTGNSKDQHHIQMGIPTKSLQLKKHKRCLENPSRYSRRRNRSDLRNSREQKIFANRKRRVSDYSYKAPFQILPRAEVNGNSLSAHSKENMSHGDHNSNTTNMLTNRPDIKNKLLGARWLILKNKVTRMKSNQLHKDNLTTTNLEPNVPTTNATLLKGFSTTSEPPPTEEQRFTQLPSTPIYASSTEQSPVQLSTTPLPLVTEEQSTTQCSTTPVALSCKEKSSMQISTTPKCLETEEQSPTQCSTTPVALSCKEKSSVQISTTPKCLVTEEQSSTQLSTVPTTPATEKQYSTQPSIVAKPLSSKEQVSVQCFKVPKPLVTEEKNSKQTDGMSGYSGKGREINGSTENKELSSIQPTIETSKINTSSNTQNEISSKECLNIFEKLLDEEKEQFNSQAKELEERMEKNLMAKIENAYNSSNPANSEIGSRNNLINQYTSSKTSDSTGGEKAVNIDRIHHSEISLQEPVYDQQNIPNYGKETTDTTDESDYEEYEDTTTTRIPLISSDFKISNYLTETTETTDESDYEEYEDTTDDTNIIHETTRIPLISSDFKISNYLTMPKTITTPDKPSSKICSPNDNSCVCSMDNVILDFTKFILNPYFFLKSVEDYNCSTWIHPPSEILLSDSKELSVKKRKKREAIVLMHSTEFFNLAKLEDMMHSTDKIVITDKHVYAVPGSTIEMNCINSEEQIDLPSEYDIKWARSDGTPLLETNEQNIEDEIMTIKNVSMKDAGNYSCTVNFTNPDTGETNQHVFMHELSLVLVPKFFLQGQARYYAPSGCNKEDKQIFKLLFPNKIKQILCGVSELCDVNITDSKCHISEKSKGMGEITVLFLIHINSITDLISGMDYQICDIMCRRKVELKVAILISRNVYTAFNITVSYRYGNLAANFTPVPNSIKFGILEGCSAGFFIQDDICFPCPAGYYSIEDSASCTKCAIGTYQPEPGSSHCEPCPNPMAAVTCAVDIDTWHLRTGIVYIGCIIALVIILICCCCCFCCWLCSRRKRKKPIPRLKKKIEDPSSTEVSESEAHSLHSRDGLSHRGSGKQVTVVDESKSTVASSPKDKKNKKKPWRIMKKCSNKSCHSSEEIEPLIDPHSLKNQEQQTDVAPTVADLFYSELKHSLNNLKKSSVLGSLCGLQSSGAKTCTIKNNVGVPIEDPVSLLRLKGSLVKSLPEDTLNKHGVAYSKRYDYEMDHRSSSAQYDMNNKNMKSNNENQRFSKYSPNNSTVLQNRSSRTVTEQISSSQPHPRDYVPEVPPTDF